MPAALKVSQRKVALTTKPKALTKAEHDKAFQNGMRQAQLQEVSGQNASRVAAQVASKLWSTPAEDK